VLRPGRPQPRPDGRQRQHHHSVQRRGRWPALRMGTFLVAHRHRRGLVRQQHEPARERTNSSSRTTGPSRKCRPRSTIRRTSTTTSTRTIPSRRTPTGSPAICDNLDPSGTVTNATGLRTQFVHGQSGHVFYVSLFNDGGATTSDIRREAIEEAVSTTVQNDPLPDYFQESGWACTRSSLPHRQLPAEPGRSL
jgi:hypothetical protein